MNSEVRTPSSMRRQKQYNQYGYNNGSHNQPSNKKKVVPFALFIAGIVIFLVMGIFIGVFGGKFVADLKATKEEPKEKYDVSEALLNQMDLEETIEFEEPKQDETKPVEVKEEPKPVVEEEKVEEEEPLEEEETEETEEEQKDENYEFYKNEIDSSLKFTTAFAFSMRYKAGFEKETPKNKKYDGVFVKSDEINSINGFACANLATESNYEELGLIDEPDTTLDDLGLVIFRDEYIKDIKPVAAGYEVYVEIPERDLFGEYTVIYENYELKGIIGQLEWKEPEPESTEDENIEGEENTEETDKKEEEKSEESDEEKDLLDENVDDEETEEEQEDKGKEFKRYNIVINNIQHI